ncbi:MAG: type II toxin-antitoxin system RelE/ParE family toxin [bacterium]
MRLHQFLAAALAEYEDAAVYYELQEPGLGGRFLLEVDEAIAFMLEFPAAGALVDGAPPELGIRRKMLNRFPVQIAYCVQDDRVVILAVFHSARRPGYWLDRLTELGHGR